MRLPPSTLILMPAPGGSIGDQAMLLGLLRVLYNARDAGPIKILNPHDKGLSWLPFIANYVRQQLEEVRVNLGTGSDLGIGAKHVLIVGADIMDGSYGDEFAIQRMDFGENMATRGARVAVTPFSFSSTISEILAQRYRRSSGIRFFCRDSVSCRAFERITNHSCEYVPDLSLFVHPATHRVTRSVLASIRSRAKDRQIVGLNLSAPALLTTKECRSGQDLFSVAQGIGGRLAEKFPSSFFLLVPHDQRSWPGRPSDRDLLVAAAGSLEKQHVPFYLMDGQIDFPQILRIVQHLRLAVSGRMHFALACARASVPCVSLIYNEKFNGFYEDFYPHNLSEVLKSETDLGILIDRVLDNFELCRRQISQRLEDVSAGGSRLFKALGYETASRWMLWKRMWR